MPCVTVNTAQILKLEKKGRPNTGNKADFLVLRKESLEIKDVLSGGGRLLANGRLTFKEAFLKGSNRKIRLEGEKK